MLTGPPSAPRADDPHVTGDRPTALTSPSPAFTPWERTAALSRSTVQSLSLPRGLSFFESLLLQLFFPLVTPIAIDPQN